MTVVGRLEHDEPVSMDSDRLTELYVRLGESRAEETLCRAMEELAGLLADLHERSGQGGDGKLSGAAQDLAARASEVGLVGLSHIALDVAYCAETGDGPALAATLARLLRAGDAALTAVWDMRDLPV